MGVPLPVCAPVPYHHLHFLRRQGDRAVLVACLECLDRGIPRQVARAGAVLTVDICNTKPFISNNSREMVMERLSKIAVYMGMGMGMTLFALLLVSVLPNIYQNSVHEWESLDEGFISEEDARAMFEEHSAYVAMYERFPDASEKFSYNGRNAEMMVGKMNFENNHSLTLDLYYSHNRENVRASVHCSIPDGPHNKSANDLFAEDFIRDTDCLDDGAARDPLTETGGHRSESPEGGAEFAG